MRHSERNSLKRHLDCRSAKFVNQGVIESRSRNKRLMGRGKGNNIFGSKWNGEDTLIFKLIPDTIIPAMQEFFAAALYFDHAG